VIAGVGLLSAGDDDAIQKAMKASEGTWKDVSRIVDGEKTSDEELKDLRLVLKGDKWTISQGKEVLGEGTYKIVVLDKNLRKVDVTTTKGVNAVGGQATLQVGRGHADGRGG
jgi:uncharacterized protein (TIGR03067 family)